LDPARDAGSASHRQALGTTERTRYVKVKTLEEGQGPEMHKWIEQAGRVSGWK
jgi:hypothetical protein